MVLKLLLNCVSLIDSPLTKKWDNFSSFGPFVMFLGVLESRGVGATFAFGFEKKYLFSKKLEHKTFCVTFFITKKSSFFEMKKMKKKVEKKVEKSFRKNFGNFENFEKVLKNQKKFS